MPKIFIEKLAVIPAKQHSSRLKNKNVLKLNGTFLFLYSVYYAIQEGFVPVVSTDSELIIRICKRNNICFVREDVNDINIANCVHNVLQTFTCSVLALLQPTSPLRVKGMLRKMYEDVISCNIISTYSSLKLKLIGKINKVLYKSYRDQDATDFFYKFDGSIICIPYSVFKSTGSLFHVESKPVVNEFPCTLEIDTLDDFKVIKSIITSNAFNKYIPDLKPHRNTICVLSNKKDLAYNYSNFVNNCDTVVRVNKMQNVGELTGYKCDIAVVAACDEYFEYSEEERNLDVLLQTKYIYWHPYNIHGATLLTKKYSLNNSQLIPHTIDWLTPNFTTLGKAIALIVYMYPNSKICFIGDIEKELRAPNMHTQCEETAYLQELVKTNILTHLLKKK